MSNLTIFEKDGTLWTDSRDVAAMVDKQHKHLLADIRGYIAAMKDSTEPKIRPSEFFAESTYTDSTGRELPCFLISKKGCEFVANKLTGQKGVLFTAAYVTGFNDMEKHLRATEASGLSALQRLRLQTQAILELDERTAAVEEKLVVMEDKVENQITLDHGQQRTLQGVVAKKAYERAAIIYPPERVKVSVNLLFQAIYRDLKNRFGVASYRDIRRVDLEGAIKLVEAWIEPADMRENADFRN